MIDREAWCAAVHRVVTDDVIWLRVTKQVALKVDPRTSAQPSAGPGEVSPRLGIHRSSSYPETPISKVISDRILISFDSVVDCIAKPAGNLRRDLLSFQKICNLSFFFFFLSKIIECFLDARCSAKSFQSCKDRVVWYHWREMGLGSSPAGRRLVSTPWKEGVPASSLLVSISPGHGFPICKLKRSDLINNPQTLSNLLICCMISGKN